jgi:hypothetical protein
MFPSSLSFCFSCVGGSFEMGRAHVGATSKQDAYFEKLILERHRQEREELKAVVWCVRKRKVRIV